MELIGRFPAGEIAEWLDVMDVQRLVGAGCAADLAAFTIPVQHFLADVIPIRTVIVRFGIPEHLVFQFGDGFFIDGDPIAHRVQELGASPLAVP